MKRESILQLCTARRSTAAQEGQGLEADLADLPAGCFNDILAYLGEHETGRPKALGISACGLQHAMCLPACSP